MHTEWEDATQEDGRPRFQFSGCFLHQLCDTERDINQLGLSFLVCADSNSYY